MAKIQSTNKQPQTLVRMWSRRKSHSLLVGIQNRRATSEDSLAVSYKTKLTFIRFRNDTPWYLPKRVENCVFTQKPAHKCLQQLYS